MPNDRAIPSWAGKLLPSSDPYQRGLDYLYGMRQLSLEPRMIDVIDRLHDREPICIWIGNNIETINIELNACLDACHECFHPWERCQVQIFATPLASAFGIDGLCNLTTSPITILIDVGRLLPRDWLGLVAHEYAHAHVGQPGHDRPFMAALSQLCLGLGLPLPSDQLANQESWAYWPPHSSLPNPLTFWRGHHLGLVNN